MKRTKQECLESLQEARDVLGESPSAGQYDELGLAPARATIMRKFGSWNEAKKEASLKILEPGDRNSDNGMKPKPKPDNVELPDGRTWEDMPPATRFYYRNKEAEKKRCRERKLKIKEWLAEYKSERGCSRCEENHHAALVFHHTTDDKSYNIARMAGKSKESIKEEIDKCIVLCANCHRKEHSDRDF